MSINGTIKCNGKILTVEKGNMNVIAAARYVCAFTVESDQGLPVKVILKGDQACDIYDLFLTEGVTKDTVKLTPTGKSKVSKEVRISFTADIREIRKTEIVTENPKGIEFNFKYTVE